MQWYTFRTIYGVFGRKRIKYMVIYTVLANPTHNLLNVHVTADVFFCLRYNLDVQKAFWSFFKYMYVKEAEDACMWTIKCEPMFVWINVCVNQCMCETISVVTLRRNWEFCTVYYGTVYAVLRSYRRHYGKTGITVQTVMYGGKSYKLRWVNCSNFEARVKVAVWTYSFPSPFHAI